MWTRAALILTVAFAVTVTADARQTAPRPVIEGVFSKVAEPAQRSSSRVTAAVIALRDDRRSASVAEVPHPDATTVDAEPGQFMAGSYTDQAGTRPYKLYVPSSYVAGHGPALPLVVMLHGCTQTPDDFAAGTRGASCVTGYSSRSRFC